MAQNEMTIDASPEDVFDVFVDAHSYVEWVVGAKRIRGADEAWPKIGTCFYHTVGVGPLTISDSSKIVESDRPRRFVLEVRTRPLGRARVTFELEQREGGTHVVMSESVIDGPVTRVSPLVEPLIFARNAETLRRLKRVVESRRGDVGRAQAG